MAGINSANSEYYMNNKNINNEYVNYREFKGWNTFFNPTDAEVSQLDYEFKNVPIQSGTLLLDVGFVTFPLNFTFNEYGITLLTIGEKNDEDPKTAVHLRI